MERAADDVIVDVDALAAEHERCVARVLVRNEGGLRELVEHVGGDGGGGAVD